MVGKGTGTWFVWICIIVLVGLLAAVGNCDLKNGDWGATDPGNPDIDWGDAPDSYCTLRVSNGAHHVAIDDLYYLGKGVDRENDGAPSLDADGDDNKQIRGDDEDGVQFHGDLVPGQTANVTVTVSQSNGYLSAWIDFNCDGDWDEPEEHVIVSQQYPAGTHQINIVVPQHAVGTNRTYARFRYSSTPNLDYFGGASDGEVEDYTVAIKESDFGDAPEPYPTMIGQNGARHMFVDGGPHLGAAIDFESDGQPDAAALGDDKDQDGDDEDGVDFTSDLIPGMNATVTVIASTFGSTCLLNAWIDFNADGDWADSGEQIFQDAAVSDGPNMLSFTVPQSYVVGATYARFRISRTPGLSYFGVAEDGEVEDYKITLYDWGDAPDSDTSPLYPTLQGNNGAHHQIIAGMYLGLGIDSESNGQPSADADGDDTNGLDDDDGVVFDNSVMKSGDPQYVTVTASAPGYLDAWIDYNGDGDWDDFDEHPLVKYPLNPGANRLLLDTVPMYVKTVDTFVRFRYSSTGGLSHSGYADDGEVEDYKVTIRQYDWGDAPSGPQYPRFSYPTLEADDGARHILVPNNIYLGAFVDFEMDGIPYPPGGALGDDYCLTGDPPFDLSNDEDGVVFSTMVSGSGATMTVTASGAGYIDAWIDYNADGDWADAGEQIFPSSAPVVAGTNVLSFTVPSNLSPAQTYARIRLSSTGNLSYYGEASDGEVEDYLVVIRAPGGGGGNGHGNRGDCDFGDAPDTYHTSLANNGPHHVACNGLVYYLGQTADCELDGFPTADASGDDLDGSPDEDGVVFNGPLVAGANASITVANSTTGFLNAWIDFDGSGTFDAVNSFGADEQIFMDQYLHSTPSTLNFHVPSGSSGGFTFARFRFNSKGGLSFEGAADNGEVEDYQVFITGGQVDTYDWGDAPSNYPTLATSNGARHRVVSGMYLGWLIDSEPDGQPSPNAMDDDNNAFADEDGVQVNGPLLPGTLPSLTVTASTHGFLDAWIDFNADGDWLDPGEHVFNAMPLSPGANSLPVRVPLLATPGTNAIARFRFSSTGGLPFDGPANDGEVEDYSLPIGIIWHQAVDTSWTGVGVNVTGNYAASDEFQITQCGRITDIGIWGSWYQNILPEGGCGDVAFNLSIYRSIPASESCTGRSMPGELIWSHRYGPGEFEVSDYCTSSTGWMTPLGDYAISEEQDCLRYKFHIDEADRFVLGGAEGNPGVYWLSVNVESPGNGALFGWMTSADSFGAASAWKNDTVVVWSYLGHPVGSGLYGNQIDMGFELYGGTDSLQISEELHIPDHFWWPAADQNNEMLRVKLASASTSEISWKSIDLRASGSGDDASDIEAVNLWIDGNVNGIVDGGDSLIGTGAYASDDGECTINLSAPQTIAPGQDIHAVISYTMASTATPGSTYQCQVASAVAVIGPDESPVGIYLTPDPLMSAKTIVGVAPVAIHSVKAAEVGSTVMLVDQEITADFRSASGWPDGWNWVYVEDGNRTSGIGVLGSSIRDARIGDSLSVLGTTYLNDNAELVIQPIESIVVSKDPEIDPLMLTNKAVGGGEFGFQPAVTSGWISTPASATGLSNAGMLVRTSGSVTGHGSVCINGSDRRVVWIDDGSALSDGYVTDLGEQSKGIAIVLPPDAPATPVTGYWAVTGIVRVISNPFGGPVRLLVPRSYADDMTGAAHVPD